jgi:hypothetical protein
MHHKQIITSTALLFAATCGHVILEDPKPFKFAEDGVSNPVTAADFPCKMPEGKKLEIDGSPHQMAIGEDQPLSFSGHAVHSGGSCQISLTSDISDDFQPRRDSRFFVIHSIEGGCPARNTSGNLDGPNIDKYSFRIPAGVNPGKYVLSWTWLPKGGSPEFYMNCSPIVVSAAKKKTVKRMRPAERRNTALAKREDFPDMYMANLKGLTGDCTNEAQKQGMAVAYPNPGKSVEHANGNEKLYMQHCDGNPRASSSNLAFGGALASASAAATASMTANTKSSPTTTVPFSPAITASQAETKKKSTATTSATPTKATLSDSTIMTTVVVTSTSIPLISHTAFLTTTTPAIRTPAHSVASSRNTDSLIVIPITTSSNSTSETAVAPSGTAVGSAPFRVTGSAAPAASTTSSEPTTCQEGYLLCINEIMYSTCTGGRWTGLNVWLPAPSVSLALGSVGI